MSLGILLASGVLGWTVHAHWNGWPRPATNPSKAGLPPVSALPPPPRIHTDWIDDPPRTRERFERARLQAGAVDPSSVPRLVEWIDPTAADGTLASGPIRIEYSLNEKLTETAFDVLQRGRVALGHAIVVDPRTGRLLAYVSSNGKEFPSNRAYPAASLVKILTAATLLEERPAEAETPCVYRGNPYRLNWRRLDRPSSGHRSTLEQALAKSYNQCFAQWAVHSVGEERLMTAFERFGWSRSPAPGHDAGQIDAVKSKLDLGRLGSGLDGARVTPLHIAGLASILTDGRWIEPWWIDRVVDVHGRSLELPSRDTERVLSSETAHRLRSMLVATTTRGTARRAFRTRRGRPVLGDIEVAGKTGNLTGGEPFGRYEWFLGLAPAENPTIAVVVLQLQNNLWWSRSSELGAKILSSIFCDGKKCREDLASRFTGDLGASTAPILISHIEQSPVAMHAPLEAP